MALRFGEYRESVDMDFLVSEIAHYRELRQHINNHGGIDAILQPGAWGITQLRPIRADQYGIRTVLSVADQPIKFEIILEGRIQLEAPSEKDHVSGIATLTQLDMAASKLLANADRWADAGVFSRDIIDLAMMQPSKPMLRQAISKAQCAYGNSILSALEDALDNLQNRQGWLERCMEMLAIQRPKALLWQRLRQLRKYQ